jgi:hypothetical protein
MGPSVLGAIRFEAADPLFIRLPSMRKIRGHTNFARRVTNMRQIRTGGVLLSCGETPILLTS